MTIIIFEACDAGGKDTTIEALHELLPHFKVKRGSSFEHSQCNQDELFEKFKGLLGLLDEQEADENIIFNRFIYSNEVYASLYEDYAILSPEQRRYFEHVISHEAVIIYLYSDEDTLKNRLKSRGDDYVKANRIPSILEKYDEAFINVIPQINILSYDTGELGTNEIVKDIMVQLKNLNLLPEEK